MKTLNGQALIQAFEARIPKSFAVENDRVGLQIGTLNKSIKRIMVTLDVLENVIDEAIEKHVDLILSHHAIIYRPLKTMRTDRGQSKLVAKCIQHDIAVYVAHTNLDIAEGGLNDWLAEALQLKNLEILAPTQTEMLYKLAVYTPISHADRVREAMGGQGAGYIGDYSYCSFNTQGLGIFRPERGADPFIGQVGKLEQVEEVKIETVVAEKQLKQVIKAMTNAHPYEEVAYDCYLLKNKGKEYGLGRIGKLESSISLKELALKTKSLFNLDGCRVVGDLDKPVKKVAVLGGDGNGFIHEAAFKGADVLITGDIYYHTAHDAILEGMSIIDVGHHVEQIMKKGVKELLDVFIAREGYEAEVLVSEANTNPFHFL
ncbi:MAG TPA: Nif3-like dinuclear metal center hexameric protein [Candidatus Angelobacter sp.]|nr:Nif3-like dinuclear metal center hexameric protein [Candidatus Angelobacter sp.]